MDEGPHRTEEKKKASSKKKEEGKKGVRLNKFIANAGLCSRREADDLIAAGSIKVNGEVVSELGTRVSPQDDVRFGDRRLQLEKTVYVLLNKPKDHITSSSDEKGRRTVMELVKNACKERLYPVGRLDRNSTGLLLLTNDGELAEKLTHPRHKVKKLYEVELDRNVAQKDLDALLSGVELEDGKFAVDAASYVKGVPNKKTIGIELHSGKNRIVRRLFEALGYKVKKLDRVMYAGLTKKDLPRGKWRYLTEKEVHFLKMRQAPQ
jgi:23S rRNA pseudouridine2605 synthase